MKTFSYNLELIIFGEIDLAPKSLQISGLDHKAMINNNKNGIKFPFKIPMTLSGLSV